MTTATSITYRLPLPPKGSGSNARGRWAKSKAAKQYREECADAYREQGLPEGAPLDLVHVDLEMRVCRKRIPELGHDAPVAVYQRWAAAHDRYRPRDNANVYDACKALLDAMQPERWIKKPSGPALVAGAGVVVSDDAKHLTLGPPRLTEVRDFGAEGVFVTVTKLLLRIVAPWTDEQVQALNLWQASGQFHPFTCGTKELHLPSKRNIGSLYATTEGWRCPHCDYRQNWAHAFMAEASDD